VQLIPRLLDPRGQRAHRRIDLRELSPADLRRQIGFVPQETFLFSATLAENIAFGVDSRDDERHPLGAGLAGLGPDIDSFPKASVPWSENAASPSRAGRSSAQPSRAPVLRDPES